MITAVDQKIAPAELGGESYDVAEAEEVLETTPQPPSSFKVTDLSIEELQNLLEQKRAENAQKAAAEAKPVKAPSKAPHGMLWVFNRTTEEFTFQYDSLTYSVAGHEMTLLPERIATHGRKRSLVSLDPVANTAVYKLVTEKDAKFGHPLKVVNRMELIDRSTDNNPLGAALRVPTHLRAIPVAGAAESMARRADQYVELE